VTASGGPKPRLVTGTFAALMASSLVFFVAGGLVLPVAPRFARDELGATGAAFGLAIGLYSLAALAARPFVGWVADRFGRRPLLVGGALLTAAATGLTLLVTTLPPFVGVHFFSPVPVMPLIELIRGSATDDATEAAVRDLAAALEKQVIVSADRPGFIVNRILMPLLGEAMRAYEQGVGTAEDIDTGARIGLNHPMGPLALADFIGLDVVLGIMRVLHEGFGEPQFAPPAVLERLVAEGNLGQKSGRGFHVYPR